MMIEGFETLFGYVVAIAMAIVAYLKTRDLGTALGALSFSDPYDDKVTTAPVTKYLPDGIWKMGQEQYDEILSGLGPVEVTAIRSLVAVMEAKRKSKYLIDTSKGRYYVENGYIEKRELNDIPLPVEDEAGRRIGRFHFERLEQSMGERISQLLPDRNQVYVVGKLASMGNVIVGIQVGNEDIRSKSITAASGQSLDVLYCIKFKLYDYGPTMQGDQVSIKVLLGYLGATEDGHDKTVWTSSKTFNFNIKH